MIQNALLMIPLRKEVASMAKAKLHKENPSTQRCTSMGTKAALWWLKHYEGIVHFWTGFSWVWVVAILLGAIVGEIELRQALCLIFLIGVVAISGVYLCIKTLSSHLKHLSDGPEKEEAHELMAKIIRRRLVTMP
jgi:hypothetical protein